MPSITSTDGLNLNVAGSKIVNVGAPTVSSDASTFIDLQNYVPTGCVKMYAGSTPPNTWLICDGSQVSRTTYANLFSVIGTTYGSGDGSTTFHVPNMQGNVVVGHNGGSYNRGQTGGSATHTITTSEMPSHSHTGTTDSSGSHSHTGTTDSAGSHSHNYSDAYFAESGGVQIGGHNVYGTRAATDSDNRFRFRTADGNCSENIADSVIPTSSAGSHSHNLTINSSTTHQHAFTTNTTGSGNAMNLMQPYVVMHYIIKT
jgi:microcystin-dependent protein